MAKYRLNLDTWNEIMEKLANLPENTLFNITNLSNIIKINATTQGKPVFEFLETLKEILEPLEFMHDKDGKLNGIFKKPEEEIEKSNFIIEKLKLIEGKLNEKS